MPCQFKVDATSYCIWFLSNISTALSVRLDPPHYNFLALPEARKSQTDQQNNDTVVALKSVLAFYLEHLFISLFNFAHCTLVLRENIWPSVPGLRVETRATCWPCCPWRCWCIHRPGMQSKRYGCV
jgi:hypothetical protein